MSKFYTAIPVDVEAVKATLPKGAFLHGIQFNEGKSQVEVHWETDAHETGLDHATEFTAAELEGGKVPKLVSKLKAVRTRKPKATAGESEGE